MMYPSRPKVTVTHVPSGISAYCDQCRTNRENHDKAMRLLMSRLWAASKIEVDPNDITLEAYSPVQRGDESE